MMHPSVSKPKRLLGNNIEKVQRAFYDYTTKQWLRPAKEWRLSPLAEEWLRLEYAPPISDVVDVSHINTLYGIKIVIDETLAAGLGELVGADEERFTFQLDMPRLFNRDVSGKR